jgi:6-phosphofructokinase 1
MLESVRGGKYMAKRIGILTAGSDSPGLNAAIRAIGKAAGSSFKMQVTAFQDGFRGLVYDKTVPLEDGLSGILTIGGTILGTSRECPEEIIEDGKMVDMTDQAISNYRKHKLDALICLGGRETQNAGHMLMQKGLNIITLPKAIDNDIPMTETSIGFDTALDIAAESIDRVHSTALSNHRILIIEIMGRRAGWLTLGAGIAGGADVVLIPEIPYDIQIVSEAVLNRKNAGKRFSIIAVAEGAISKENANFFEATRKANEQRRTGEAREKVAEKLKEIQGRHKDNIPLLADRLEKVTGLETRTTILGYLLRGGIPSTADRLLATQLGTYAVTLVEKGTFGVMTSVQGGNFTAVPLDNVAGKHKSIPADHPWIESAHLTGICLGD